MPQLHNQGKSLKISARRRARLIAAAAVGVGAAAYFGGYLRPARASVWDPATPPYGTFEDPANWVGGVPNSNGASAVFNLDSTPGYVTAMNSSVVLGSMLFNYTNPSLPFSIVNTGGNITMVMNSGGPNTTSTITNLVPINTGYNITLNVPVGIGTPTVITNQSTNGGGFLFNSSIYLNINSSAPLTVTGPGVTDFGGPLVGSGPIIHNGTGMLAITGNVSAFLGPITVNNGTVNLSNPSGDPGWSQLPNSSITVNPGGTLGLNITGNFNPTVTLVPGGTIQSSGSNTTIGGKIIVPAGTGMGNINNTNTGSPLNLGTLQFFNSTVCLDYRSWGVVYVNGQLICDEGGILEVCNGTLVLGQTSTSSQNVSLTIDPGSTLNVNGHTDNSGGITAQPGSKLVGSGGTSGLTGTVTVGNNVTFAANQPTDTFGLGNINLLANNTMIQIGDPGDPGIVGLGGTLTGTGVGTETWNVSSHLAITSTTALVNTSTILLNNASVIETVGVVIPGTVYSNFSTTLKGSGGNSGLKGHWVIGNNSTTWVESSQPTDVFGLNNITFIQNNTWINVGDPGNTGTVNLGGSIDGGGAGTETWNISSKLSINSTTALMPTSTVLVNNNATLAVVGVTTPGIVVVNDGGTLTGTGTSGVGGTTRISNFGPNETVTFTATNGTITLGPIVASNNNTWINIPGGPNSTGTVQLGGPLTGSGAGTETWNVGGTLSMNVSTALTPTSTVNMYNSTVIQTNGIVTPGNFTVMQGGGTIQGSGTNSGMSGKIVFTGPNLTLFIDGGGNLNQTFMLPSVLPAANTSLVLGAHQNGHFVFSAANGGDNSTATATWVVDSGSSLDIPLGGILGNSNIGLYGTLTGKGTFGRVDTYSGSVLAPGADPGVLTSTSGIDTSGGGTVQFEIDGPTVGTQYDQQLVEAGGVTLGSGAATLQLLMGYTPTPGSEFWIINNTGTGGGDTTTGYFAGLSEGSTFTQGGDTFTIYYNADLTGNTTTGGNDVLIVATIPEPASIGMLIVGAGLSTMRRRRRRSRIVRQT